MSSNGLEFRGISLTGPWGHESSVEWCVELEPVEGSWLEKGYSHIVRTTVISEGSKNVSEFEIVAGCIGVGVWFGLGGLRTLGIECSSIEQNIVRELERFVAELEKGAQEEFTDEKGVW